MKSLSWGMLALAALATPTLAQDNSSNQAKADEVVVTATRFDEPKQDVPVGVTIITADDIQASGVSTLPQLLARQPGIVVRDNSGNPDQSVDMRSFGATGDQNTLILVDGERLSENELTSARWSTIPLAAIDRIEIVRGSGAVLYGSGASGGVINIITKGPRLGQRDVDAYGSYGAYDTLDLRAGGTIAGDHLGLTINGGYLSSDNYRDHNRVDQNSIEATLRTLAMNPSLAFKFGLDRQELQLPGARTEAQFATDPRGATTPHDFADRNGGHGLLTARIDLGFGELAADFGYRNKDASSSVFFFGNTTRTDTMVDTWSASPRLKIPHHLIAGESTLVAGFDWSFWDYDSRRDLGPAHVSAIQRNQAFYLQHSTQFRTGTILSLGARWQESYMSARDEDTGTPYGAGNQTTRPRAYELALRQDVGTLVSIYGKLGRSFRTATVDEIYNQFGGPFFDPIVTFLQPQTSNNRELGVEVRSDRMYFRGSLYYMTLENEIHFDPTSFNNINLPPTRRSGAELEGRWRILRWLEAAANYTYALAEFRSGTLGGADVSGDTIPLVPRHKFTLSGNVDFTADTRLNLVFNYVGTQFFDGDETNTFGEKMPAYRTVDVRLSHQIGKWTLAATAMNLFNEKYFTYGLALGPPAGFIVYPQPTCGVFFSAEYHTH